jgi:hypothetical protein
MKLYYWIGNTFKFQQRQNYLKNVIDSSYSFIIRPIQSRKPFSSSGKGFWLVRVKIICVVKNTSTQKTEMVGTNHSFEQE